VSTGQGHSALTLTPRRANSTPSSRDRANRILIGDVGLQRELADRALGQIDADDPRTFARVPSNVVGAFTGVKPSRSPRPTPWLDSIA